MPENLFIPSVDLRIASLEEYNRRQKEKAAAQRNCYGCLDSAGRGRTAERIV